VLVSFVVLRQPDPHPARGRRALLQHPELAALAGRNPKTALLTALLVALQLGLASAVGLLSVPWWGALLLAWTVGAFVAHALFAAMHEAAHGLVFRRRPANDAMIVLANLPLLAPFGFPFAWWHLEHHRRQGQQGRDPDLPAAWELRVFPQNLLGKLAWHVLFVPIQLFRIEGGPSLLTPRFLSHLLLQGAVTVCLGWWLGGGALLYLAASLYFVYSLHPLSGRFIQEHHLLPGMGEQETTSYVGPLNRLSLNFGLHTEHHDFPAVPWDRLPRVRELAPELYAGRIEHRSWTALWLRLLFDPRVSHASRGVRAP
jgi:sphingolipid delta-4 desaturase